MKDLDETLVNFSNACDALACNEETGPLFKQLELDSACSRDATKIWSVFNPENPCHDQDKLEKCAKIIRETLLGVALTSYIVGFRNGKRRKYEKDNTNVSDSD